MGQADEFLRRARNHLERVRDAAPHPTDWFDLTIYGFYCVEAAVMAAASFAGFSVDKTHPAKAAAARSLANRHGLPDVSTLLATLNAARKAAAYGDRPLPPLDPAQLLTEAEQYVESVANFIGT